MRTVFVVVIMCLTVNVIGQTTSGIETKKFYDALNKGDSTGIAAFLSEDLKVVHYEGDSSFSFNYAGFMKICPKFKSGYFREDFTITHESGYPGTEIVNVDFKFFLDGKHDHCGRDVVIWKAPSLYEAPKISEIHSYNSDCEENSNPQINRKDWMVERLNALMDAWHEAAAEANFEKYFGFMAEDFYYLGTDPSERWTKEQFANFCRPHFEKGKAWDFKTIERNFYFSSDLSVIWFDEKLETWMEDCRGSGVIEFVNMTNGDDGWSDFKLKHYNLTVTIENEKIQDFIKLRKK